MVFDTRQMERYSSTQATYVAAAQNLGIPLSLVTHGVATRTCQEKAELLGWEDQSRIVQTMYLSRRGHVVGIVSPSGAEKLDTRTFLQQAFAISGKAAKGYGFIDVSPFEMQYGTCTPFAKPSLVGIDSKIHALLVVDRPSLDEKIVDVSIGGTDEMSLSRSFQLPYGKIYPFLFDLYGVDVVAKV
jgi:hypothetical protein